MKREEFIRLWKKAFASTVSADVMKNHIEGRGNYLWHAFTFGKVPCSMKSEANKAFDAADKNEALMICLDRRGDNTKTERLPMHITALDLIGEAETFVVGKKFAWTYVVTHEAAFGPYFCRKSDLR